MKRSVAISAAMWGLIGAMLWGGEPVAGAVDDTAALQTKFSSLKSGDILTLDPGRTYQYSKVLTVTAAGVRIDGNGATLVATNPASAALQLLANNVTLTNLKIGGGVGATRQDGTNQARLVFGGDGVLVSDVSISGGASAGIYVASATNFRMDRVTVRDTAADGIQISAGSQRGQLNNAVVERSGDDAIAIVSYLYGYPQAAPCHDIVINSPAVDKAGQRGLVITGAQNIAITNPTVARTALSGIFVGSQGWPFYTAAVKGVQITGGKITEGNNGGGMSTAALTVFSQNYLANVSDVTVEDLTIADTPKAAVANIGIAAWWAGPPANIVLRNIAITQSLELPAVWANVARASYATSGFTMNGRPLTVP